MAETARGIIAEALQQIDGGRKMSQQDVVNVLNVAYAQMTETMDTHMEQVRQYEARISELEGLLKNGKTSGPFSGYPTRDRPPAYAKLMDVLNRAHDQAAFGKGLDRHVSKEAQPFHEQPICSLQRIYGNGYAFGQVGKKMEESFRLPKKQAIEELLGGLVYLAAAVIVREEEDDGEEAQEA